MQLHATTPSYTGANSLTCALQCRSYSCMFLSTVQDGISGKERGYNSNTSSTLLYNTNFFFLVPWYLHGEHSMHGPRSLCLGIHRNSLLAVRQYQADALWGNFSLGYHWLGGWDPEHYKANSFRCGIRPPSAPQAAHAFPGEHGCDFQAWLRSR